jgi:hypothetical protein
MNAEITIETITPLEAAKLLKCPWDGQRRLRKTVVDKYVHEMQLHRWTLSNDAILIVRSALANGQHRLHAVVDSGLAQRFLVMRTNDDQLYKVLDSGLCRTIPDKLGLRGTTIPAAARVIIAYQLGWIGFDWTGTAVTHGDIIEFLESKNSDGLQECAERAEALCLQRPFVSKSYLAAFLFLAERCEHGNFSRIECFLEGALFGLAKPPDARAALNNRLILNSHSKAKLRKEYVFAMVIKAWNLYIRAVPITVLRFSQEEKFPRF